MTTRRYFYSGWAFLIPYLVVYLLYYVTKWPVNAANRGQMPDVGSQMATPWVPCMLHVYWAVHAIHVILAGFALWSWWTKERRVAAVPESNVGPSLVDAPSENSVGPQLVCAPLSGFGTDARSAPTQSDTVRTQGATLHNNLANLRPPSSGFWPLASQFAPWALLALIFYIPGVYLEWPSDPWQHFTRLNEWSWYDTVDQHSFWSKTSYFLGYSLIGHINQPFIQLKWFNVYYTACCLLLCWQYFLLAKTIKLGDRASLIFVILQTLLFGNFIFGFYRYYGMSSTIFAQLGAVALTRIVLEFASRGTRLDPSFQEDPSPTNKGMPLAHASDSVLHSFGLPSLKPYLVSLTTSLLCLTALTAFNHPQAIGIAGLGIGAVIVWRLIEWRRSMIWWLVITTLILNIAVLLWYPRHPLLYTQYRSGGWLTAWYGFNLFWPGSNPLGAFDRTMAVIGAIGIANLGAGLILLRRNRIVAWLTILPPLALSLPLFAVPFSGIILKHNTAEGLITFTRVLLEIPAGLALITFYDNLARSIKRRATKTESSNRVILPPSWSLLIVTLSVLVLTPAGSPYYNRLFNVLAVPPSDLSMEHVLRSPELESIFQYSPYISLEAPNTSTVLEHSTAILTSPGIAYVMQSTGKASIPEAARQLSPIPAKTANAICGIIEHVNPAHIKPFSVRPVDTLYSPYSQAGWLSQHWVQTTVALEHSAVEIFDLSFPAVIKTERRLPHLWVEFLSDAEVNYFIASGAGTSLRTAHEDRGLVNSMAGFNSLAANKNVVIRPVFRTLDGNGWRIAVTINGPGSFHRSFGKKCQPNLLGGDSWLVADFNIKFPTAGQYTIDITGDTVWPPTTYNVRYTLTITDSVRP